jgi:hypothetical protein
MKTKKYFLSTLSALLLTVVTQTAAAHMLFTYQTAKMNWISEKTYDYDGTQVYLDFFRGNEFQFDVSFITPDLNFDLDEGEVRTMQFDNPIVSVSPYAPFITLSIERSSFAIEAYKHEGTTYTDWSLIFDIINDDLNYDAVITASINSRGNWDYMSVHLEDYHYLRGTHEYILDSDAEFAGEYYGEYPNEVPGLPRFSMKHISVPEPLSPVLLLLGLAGIFATRKYHRLKYCHDCLVPIA